MSSARAERLVNLVLCLLSTRQFLTADRIRRTVPGYEASGDDAFFRMFERDKSELRDLGVPLEMGSAALDDGDGYRIARRDYELGDVDLEPDEAAAVALAARLWDSPDLAGAARGALHKLRAAGIDVDAEPGPPIEPRVRAPGPALTGLTAAVQDGRAVTFAHRSHAAAEPVTRTLEPWGVVSWRGRWYVAGHDRDRDATRCFRLSRIVGTVEPVGPPGAVHRPHGTDLLGIVAAAAEVPGARRTARLWLADDRAQGLRRHASILGRLDLDGVPGELVSLQLPGLDTAARWVAGYGPDAVVVEPAELAEAVRARLLAAGDVAGQAS